MNCEKCGSTLRIAKQWFESPIGTTKVTSVMLMVCVNPDCTEHETDLENPTKIAKRLDNDAH